MVERIEQFDLNNYVLRVEVLFKRVIFNVLFSDQIIVVMKHKMCRANILFVCSLVGESVGPSVGLSVG